jgi:manganese/zinc/iron transport system ATP- binding protein
MQEINDKNRKTPAIELEDLTVAYKDQPALWDIDLSVPKGALMAVIGPNGAGKSTLIKSILGLVKISTGQVNIFGKPYKQQKKKLAYVPQRNSVDWDFPTNVLDVVLMGRYGQLGWIKRPGKLDRELAMEALTKVGMDKYVKRQISQLSGGQQQRVFLARAVVQNADIYLMDEPFQGVDVTTEKAISKLLRDFRDKDNKTLVVVHHDLNTVNEYFDMATILNISVIASGKMEDVMTRENLIKAYGGEIALLKVNTNK